MKGISQSTIYLNFQSWLVQMLALYVLHLIPNPQVLA